MLKLESSWLRLVVGWLVVVSSSDNICKAERSPALFLDIAVFLIPTCNTNDIIILDFILQKETLPKVGPCILPSFGEEDTEDYLEDTVLNAEGKAAVVRVLYVAKSLLAIK